MEETIYKFTWKKFFKHLSTIIRHRHYVFKFCLMCGIPFRGLVHDLSKFSFAEFWPNVKYTENGISPIEIQKKVNGYSMSWFHHKSHNKHHYEYWMDRFDNGGYTTRMPTKDAIEMICDFLGANKAYSKTKTGYRNELSWWISHKDSKNIHPDTKQFIGNVFEVLAFLEDMEENEEDRFASVCIKNKDGNIIDKNIFFYHGILNKKVLTGLYKRIIDENNNPIQVPIKNLSN